MASSSKVLESTSLSAAQLNAITLLASGNSIMVAAQETNVSRATLYNWLKLPEFHDVLEQCRRDAIAYTHAKLGELAELAIDTIRQTLTDSTVSPAVRLRAALAVIDRPLFPKPLTPVPQEADEDLQPASEPPPHTATPAPFPSPTLDIARNAPCPCGSGNKYKRCCGTNAPPLLGRVA